MSDLAPKSIHQAGPKDLQIEWSDGHVSLYPVRLLRTSCRCAACVDEWSGLKILNPSLIPAEVKPINLYPVGRYAISIEWSDGHRSGIYTFEHLREICPCEECRKQAGRAPEKQANPSSRNTP